MKKWFVVTLGILLYNSLLAEDGYRLWLRYNTIDNVTLLQQYRSQIASISCAADNEKLQAAQQELQTGLSGLLGKKIPLQVAVNNGTVLLGLPSQWPFIRSQVGDTALARLDDEGFIIRTIRHEGKNIILITGNKE